VDVLFNTFGAVAAAGIILLASASIESERRRSARTSVIAAGLFALVVAATGVLLSPSLPSSTYYGQWTPERGRLERYGGSVVSATVGQDSIPPHPFPIEVLRDRFLSGVPLVVKAVAGPPPPGLAPIVSVYDELQRRILFVGAAGDDLVCHLRTRAGSLALDEAGQRVSGALGGVISGEPVVITVQRQPAGQCVSVDGVESCAQVEASDGWVA